MQTPPAVTTITGGAFALKPGSGTLAVSPDNAKANAVVSRITVTYTAVTSLTNASIQITVPVGIKASAATGEAGSSCGGGGSSDTKRGQTFRLQADRF